MRSFKAFATALRFAGLALRRMGVLGFTNPKQQTPNSKPLNPQPLNPNPQTPPTLKPQPSPVFPYRAYVGRIQPGTEVTEPHLSRGLGFRV